MTEKNENILDGLNKRVDGDVLALNYAHAIAQIAQLSPEEKTRLLMDCAAVLRNERASKDERLRITAVRVLVALLPMSLEVITSLLNKFAGRHHYEVHYTLFCYLDWAQEMPYAASLTQSILPLVETYFLSVPRQTAHAVWMAADMMGEHWDVREAIPLLTGTALATRYAVGREGSILGLEKIVGRLAAGSSEEEKVLKTLREVSLSDRSGRVRKEAQSVLRERRNKSNESA